MDADFRLSRGLRGYQGFFLVLTLVVIIVVVLLAPNLTTAIIIIGLIANYFIISTQLTLLGDRQLNAAQPRGGDALSADIRAAEQAAVAVSPPAAAVDGMLPAPGREGFSSATTAPPGAGPPAFPLVPETEAAGAYPGAIDFGGTFGAPEFLPGPADASDEAPALGFSDLSARGRDGAPPGNPFDTDRVAGPAAAGACVDDDAVAMYDADELNAYHARARNDPERAWAGVYRRKALVDRYVKEELDERENSRWWGVHEV